ncbi:MAG TPA: 2OG-Fe(II) oxygenase, partial [Pyrinomonadaceae bacterium]|nr:2OG-Fe(II) oxygenase [Pyrinomonadaceae bacterium]
MLSIMSHPAAIKQIPVSWTQVYEDLDAEGNAIIRGMLSSDECDRMRALYENEDIFRSQVVMERHGFGRGEYKYFRYPLPDLIAALRTSIYPHLVSTANAWNKAMEIDVRFPAQHADFIER